MSGHETETVPGAAGAAPDLVTVILTTYDRANVVGRAIESVLAQDCQDWRLVIVDDGSRDGTQAVLDRYPHPAIEVVSHDRNRGAAAARNSGLDAVATRWFTFLDSDDEMVASAIGALLHVPRAVDPTVDAVTCDCVDARTGMATGIGLPADGPVSFETEVRLFRGDQWGITAASLLRGLRFCEDVAGHEDLFYYQISARARRYYLKRGLLVYHREGVDHLSSRSMLGDMAQRARLDRRVWSVPVYVEAVRKWRAEEYGRLVFNRALVAIVEGRRSDAAGAARELGRCGTLSQRAFILVGRRLGSRGTLAMLSISNRARAGLETAARGWIAGRVRGN